MRTLLLLLPALLYAAAPTRAQFWAMKPGDPVSCPPMTEKPADNCLDTESTCWSPGKPDTDCPGNGLCCFDGCAATCLGVSQPVAMTKKKVVQTPTAAAPAPVKKMPPQVPAKKVPLPTPTTPLPSYTPVNTSPLPLYQPVRTSPLPTYTPVKAYPSPAPLPPLPAPIPTVLPVRVVTPPSPTKPPKSPYFTQEQTVVGSNQGYPTVRPPPPRPAVSRRNSTKCPPASVRSENECYDAEPNCWSRDVPDTDCPGFGLCCFDGCVNTCLDTVPPPPPPPSPPRRPYPTDLPPPPSLPPHRPYPTDIPRIPDSPCKPTPCGKGTLCKVTKEGNPMCICLPGLVPKPDTITGCGPECNVDSDCRTGQVCDRYECKQPKVVIPVVVDPCNPAPCGPGTHCRIGDYEDAVCDCLPGLFRKSDPLAGCGPECTVDVDCQQGFVCRNQVCVEKVDPCSPSPCGPGAYCVQGGNGRALCSCNEGLFPKPDPIDGCGPECDTDTDCRNGFVCQSQRCVEEPSDPCNPSPCGPGTTCQPNSFGKPTCKCLEGLFPKPDMITGCGPECQVDSDCSHGLVCRNQYCTEIERHVDPCNPNPCGMMAECSPRGKDDYECTCPRGTFGNGYAGCQQGECLADDDCSQDKACLDFFCINPCLTKSPCAAQDQCRVNNHLPLCGPNEQSKARAPVVIGGEYTLNSRVGRGRSRTVVIGEAASDQILPLDRSGRLSANGGHLSRRKK